MYFWLQHHGALDASADVIAELRQGRLEVLEEIVVTTGRTQVQIVERPFEIGRVHAVVTDSFGIEPEGLEVSIAQRRDLLQRRQRIPRHGIAHGIELQSHFESRLRARGKALAHAHENPRARCALEEKTSTD